jgi:hypothetical protein
VKERKLIATEQAGTEVRWKIGSIPTGTDQRVQPTLGGLGLWNSRVCVGAHHRAQSTLLSHYIGKRCDPESFSYWSGYAWTYPVALTLVPAPAIGNFLVAFEPPPTSHLKPPYRLLSPGRYLVLTRLPGLLVALGFQRWSCGLDLSGPSQAGPGSDRSRDIFERQTGFLGTTGRDRQGGSRSPG